MTRHLFATILVLASIGGSFASAATHKELLRDAHKGDAVAMRKVGYNQFAGKGGFKQNRRNGFGWLKLAAEKGDTQALYYLGCIYQKGTYVGMDLKEAERYFSQAAAKGHENAKKKLEELRSKPEEETRLADEKSTSKPTKKEKNIDAVNKESEIKERSSSIVGNEEKPNVAQKTDSKAEKKFAVDNTRERFESYVKDVRDGKISYEECVVIAKKYYEIEEYTKSFALNIIAAEGGNEEAQETLNRRFGGGGMWPWAKKDAESIRIINLQYTAEAQKWFKLATEKFDAEAQYNMGLYWEYIVGGVLSTVKSLAWREVAATQGHVEAQFSVGRHFYELAQMPHNAERKEEFLGRATKYLKMASDQGYKRAAKLLAELEPAGKTQEKFSSPVVREVSDKAKKDFQKGYTHYCTENSLEKAVEFFTSSAHEGYADAQFYLGLCYMGGKGVNRDLCAAFIWILRAAEQGHARAQYGLAQCYEKGMGVRERIIRRLSSGTEKRPNRMMMMLSLSWLCATCRVQV